MNVGLGYYQKFLLSWGATIVLVCFIGVFGPDLLRKIWFEIGLLALIVCFYAIPPVYFLPGKSFNEPGLKMSDEKARQQYWVHYGFTWVGILLSVGYTAITIPLKLFGVWG